jgi:Holliday junction DNA helicase RuvA
MFQYLYGKVTEKGIDNIVVDVNGAGYYVLVSNPNEYVYNEFAKVYIYYALKENELTLYGFPDSRTKSVFLRLISVTSIGPKTAIQILSAITIDSFIFAVESGNIAVLKKLPGIGPKTASQIILDLKNKLVYEEPKSTTKVVNQDLEDAITGLTNLGYKKSEIEPIIKTLSSEKRTVSQYITTILALLGKVK